MSATLMRAYRPSIAQEAVLPRGNRREHALAPNLRSAAYAFSVLLAGAHPTYAYLDLTQGVQAAPDQDAVNSAAVTSQELVSALKSKGMPIAALSDILDVERKTIYSWLDDKIDANAGNFERLALVHRLLVGEADGSLRFYHRFWERKLPSGGTLKAELTAKALNEASIRTSLEALRPAVTRAMQADADRRANARDKVPGSSLTLNLRVG